jgi:hypothetical protein
LNAKSLFLQFPRQLFDIGDAVGVPDYPWHRFVGQNQLRNGIRDFAVEFLPETLPSVGETESQQISSGFCYLLRRLSICN